MKVKINGTTCTVTRTEGDRCYRNGGWAERDFNENGEVTLTVGYW